MYIISTQACASPAYAAINAMVYFLVAVVIPQLADLAVVARSLHPTMYTILASLLRGSTAHAKHILRLRSIQIMVLDSVVTVATGVPPATGEALHLDIALVVLASKRCLLLKGLELVVFKGEVGV